MFKTWVLISRSSRNTPQLAELNMFHALNIEQRLIGFSLLVDPRFRLYRWLYSDHADMMTMLHERRGQVVKRYLRVSVFESESAFQ